MDDIVYSTNTNITSVEDGDIVEVEGQNITINSGVLVTTSNRCKGLKFICHGDFTVNGTLSMTARGAHAAGASVPIISPFNGTTLATLDATGAAGGVGPWGDSGGIEHGTVGADGSSRKCGGGGSGAIAYVGHIKGGDGGDATSYSGGTGGGGGYSESGEDGADDGGAGGAGESYGYGTGGGAGNPPGFLAVAGTGGLLIILCNGQVTISATGVVSSNGSTGGAEDRGGGGSGGGSINIFYRTGYTNDGSVVATGGIGGTGYIASADGGTGGAGSVTATEIPSSNDGVSILPSLDTTAGSGATGNCTFPSVISKHLLSLDFEGSSGATIWSDSAQGLLASDVYDCEISTLQAHSLSSSLLMNKNLFWSQFFYNSIPGVSSKYSLVYYLKLPNAITGEEGESAIGIQLSYDTPVVHTTALVFYAYTTRYEISAHDYQGNEVIDYYSSTPVTANEWHKVEFSVNEDTVSVKFDGIEITSCSSAIETPWTVNCFSAAAYGNVVMYLDDVTAGNTASILVAGSTGATTSCVMPRMLVSATTPYVGRVAVTLPAMTSTSGSTYHASAEITLPSLTITARSAAVAIATVSLKALTVTVRSGERIYSTLPLMTASARAVRGQLCRAAIQLKPLTVEAEVMFKSKGDGACSLPKLSAVVTMSTRPSGAGNMNLPLMTARTIGVITDRFATTVLEYTRP